MFEWLFGYPVGQWREADWVLLSDWPVGVLLLLLVAVPLLLGWFAVRGLKRRSAGPTDQSPTRTESRRALLLVALQSLLVALLLLILWQPALQVSEPQPADNQLALVFDTSGSMLHAGNGASRLSTALAALQRSAFVEQLESHFDIRLWSLSDALAPVSSIDELPSSADGKPASRLTTGLNDLLSSAGRDQLAGLVLVSDGAATDSTDVRELRALAATGVPLYSVGSVGENLGIDAMIRSVEMPQVVLQHSQVRAVVEIQSSQAGSFRLRVLQGDSLKYSETLSLASDTGDGSATLTGYFAIQFDSGEPGVHPVTFELTELDGDELRANNVARRVLQVTAEPLKVLYLEGQPRWEYKFIRRALADLGQIELVSVLHTSANKFYRQGVSSDSQLASGFPADRPELFAYDVVIIGSLEAAMLGDQQQRDLLDFVRQRGAALLMLGGESGLGAGGWSHTALAEALPVGLDVERGKRVARRTAALPTASGRSLNWFGPESAGHWDTLPELADYQFVGPVRPGANVLLQIDAGPDRIPLLSWQRYGQGVTAVLATSGTWRWRMQLPLEDDRHEQFWQSLLSELGASVMRRAGFSDLQPIYRDTRRVELQFDLRNENFEPENESEIVVDVTSPSGETLSTQATAVGSVGGRYRLTIPVRESGDWQLQLAGDAPDTGKPAIARWFRVEQDSAEDYAMAADESWLQGLSRLSGGQHLGLDELPELIDRLSETSALHTRKVTYPLSYIPLVFLLLAGLKLIEWLLRKRWSFL